MEKNSDIFKEMIEDNMNSNDIEKISKIDQLLNQSSIQEISSNEKDTLAFIRNNVIKEISSKKEKSIVVGFKYTNILKYAAIFLVIFSSFIYYQSALNSNESTFLTGSDFSFISDTKEVLTSFTSLTNESPKMILEINIEKANSILDDLSRIKQKNNSKEFEQLISDMERILLAISSIETDDVYLQIQLIQSGIKKKKVLKQLDGIKI